MNEEDYWKQFPTGVGLITTRIDGKDNIMAAAWTYQISYEPGLIVVCIGADKLTAKNIEKSKEFGVHLASVDQNVVSSIAGGNSGGSVDKIAVLKEMGCEFFEGKKIKTLLLKGCALCVECKLKEKIDVGGDHIVYIGEVVHVHDEEAKPLLFKGGKYLDIGRNIEKPAKEGLEKINALLKKHGRK